jgi:hypothetical protein
MAKIRVICCKIFVEKRRKRFMQTVEEIYQQYIKPLPDKDKLRLIAKVSNDLAETEIEKPKRSIMELHGLGKEIWKGIDAQEYVNELRNEWDHRP